MTNPNLTSIHVIIDRSGSMEGLKAETVGAFNHFLKTQQAVPGAALFSLTLFDHNVEIIYDSVNIQDVKPLTLEQYWGEGGYTALYDAVGISIATARRRYESLPEEDRPSKVIFMIMTDGQENRSKEYRGGKLQQIVNRARTEWQWEFTMIGANIDTFATAESMGFNASNAVNFVASKGGMRGGMRAAAGAMKSYRAQTSAVVSDFYSTVTTSSTISGEEDLIDFEDTNVTHVVAARVGDTVDSVNHLLSLDKIVIDDGQKTE